jgi:WD40 repeat protein
LWNEKYLLVGASDKTVKLVNLNNGDILDNLECNEEVCGIKKINSNKFGECLLLQGKSFNGQIKLWKNMNQSNKNI